MSINKNQAFEIILGAADCYRQIMIQNGQRTELGCFDEARDMIESLMEADELLELAEILLLDEDLKLQEAEYQGRKVTLNKPTRGDVKKFKVYVKDPKTGNVKKVNFGDPNMRIKKSNPKKRKSFRARHKCDQKKDKTTPGYWSCNWSW